MSVIRKTWPSSSLLPDGLFIRTLQGPPPNHVKLEKSTGRFIVSSQAFRPSSSDGKISGDLAQILEADGLSPTALYPAVERALGAAALCVDAVRKTGCEVEHGPLSHNWYHGGITGVDDKKSRMKRALQESSFEIIEIDQVEARRQHDEKEAQIDRLSKNLPE